MVAGNVPSKTIAGTVYHDRFKKHMSPVKNICEGSTYAQP